MLDFLFDRKLLRGLKKSFTWRGLRCRHRNMLERKPSYFEALRERRGCDVLLTKEISKCLGCGQIFYAAESLNASKKDARKLRWLCHETRKRQTKERKWSS